MRSGGGTGKGVGDWRGCVGGALTSKPSSCFFQMHVVASKLAEAR